MRFIEIPQWGNATIVELAWLASGLLALLFASLRLRPLSQDFHNARGSREHDLFIIARGYFRRELLRIVQAVAIISIGLYAAQEPPVVPGPARTTVTGLILTAVLIVVSLIISVQSILDWRDREEVKSLQEHR